MTTQAKPQGLLRSLQREVHGLGHKVYAKNWDRARHAFCRSVSRGRTTSSSELTMRETWAVLRRLRRVGEKWFLHVLYLNAQEIARAEPDLETAAFRCRERIRRRLFYDDQKLAAFESLADDLHRAGGSRKRLRTLPAQPRS